MLSRWSVSQLRTPSCTPSCMQALPSPGQVPNAGLLQEPVAGFVQVPVVLHEPPTIVHPEAAVQGIVWSFAQNLQSLAVRQLTRPSVVPPPTQSALMLHDEPCFVPPSHCFGSKLKTLVAVATGAAVLVSRSRSNEKD